MCCFARHLPLKHDVEHAHPRDEGDPYQEVDHIRRAASAALYMAITAAALGASIPALIYADTRAWAALTIESRRAA